MPPPRIVVFGGSGFLGSRICRAAVQRLCLVTSISRSGRPHPHAPHHPDITYERADIFHPEDYAHHLVGSAGIIYSIGTLLEGDYKTSDGRIDPDKMFELLRQSRTANPMKADPENPRSYNRLNRDGAILAALEGLKAGVPVFTYISAAGNFPAIPARYLESKRYSRIARELADNREAEQVISTHPELKGIRPVIMRPGVMYESGAENNPLVLVMQQVSRFNSLIGGLLSNILPYGGMRPLDVDVVARATVAATLDEGVRGIIDVDKIAVLGS